MFQSVEEETQIVHLITSVLASILWFPCQVENTYVVTIIRRQRALAGALRTPNLDQFIDVRPVSIENNYTNDH